MQIFQAGEYEDAILGNSTWADGDWNGDGEFTSQDLVAAFQEGSYEVASMARGRQAAAADAVAAIAAAMQDHRWIPTFLLVRSL